jgi:galactose mutarotase-like enzyme
MSDPQSPRIALCSTEIGIEVAAQGAELSALRDRDGRDLLWDGDPSVWAGRAPLLFPIVGALAGGHYRVNGRSYALPRHGFARGRRFDVLESTASSALLRLVADVNSLQVYPFHFELTVHFALHGSTLTITAHVRNAGDVVMPASFGYHPAFRWPLPYGCLRGEHFIEFARDEPGPMRRLNGDGLLTPVRHASPIVQRRLALSDALFQEDVMIFDEVVSRSVTYGADTGPRIQVRYPDSTYLGVWAKPGAPFVCIEPWHGVADPVGFSGDFAAKPGVFLVEPGAAVPIEMAISLVAP